MTTASKTPEFGSADWFAAAQAALNDLDTGDTELVLEQQILADGNDLRYQLIIKAGKATIHAVNEMSDPPAAKADVSLVQPASVAVKIRSGQLGALAAIQSGQIEINGDVTKLLAAADTVAAVDQALSNLAP